MGWIYVFAWCLQFYPQAYLVWWKKDADGFSHDMLLLQNTASPTLCLQNFLLYYVPELQREYEALHPRKPLPVKPNDLASNLHSVIASLLWVFLVLRKKGFAPRVTIVGYLFFFGSLAALGIGIILSLCNLLSWLSTVYILGAIKVAVCYCSFLIASVAVLYVGALSFVSFVVSSEYYFVPLHCFLFFWTLVDMTAPVF